MPLYIALVTYTDRGMQAVRDSPRRLDQAKARLAGMGGRFQAVYMTMGAHDLVFVYEAPDDAVAARFTLGLGRCTSRPGLAAAGPGQVAPARSRPPPTAMRRALDAP